jgi:excisionase family DNA binding protein
MLADLPLDLGALADALADRLAERLAGTPPKRFLSVREASHYAGVSEDSIRNLLAGGNLTALRPVPGRVVIDRQELDAYVRGATRRARSGRGTRNNHS